MSFASMENLVRPWVTVVSPRNIRLRVAPEEVLPDATIRWGKASSFGSDPFRDAANFPAFKVEDIIPPLLLGAYYEEARTWSDFEVHDPEDNDSKVVLRRINEIAFVGEDRGDNMRGDWSFDNPLGFLHRPQVTFTFPSSFTDQGQAYLENSQHERFQPIQLDPFNTVVEVGWGNDDFVILVIQVSPTTGIEWRIVLENPNDLNVSNDFPQGDPVFTQFPDADPPIDNRDLLTKPLDNTYQHLESGRNLTDFYPLGKIHNKDGTTEWSKRGDAGQNVVNHFGMPVGGVSDEATINGLVHFSRQHVVSHWGIGNGGPGCDAPDWGINKGSEWQTGEDPDFPPDPFLFFPPMMGVTFTKFRCLSGDKWKIEKVFTPDVRSWHVGALGSDGGKFQENPFTPDQIKIQYKFDHLGDHATGNPGKYKGQNGNEVEGAYTYRKWTNSFYDPDPSCLVIFKIEAKLLTKVLRNRFRGTDKEVRLGVYAGNLQDPVTNQGLEHDTPGLNMSPPLGRYHWSWHRKSARQAFDDWLNNLPVYGRSPPSIGDIWADLTSFTEAQVNTDEGPFIVPNVGQQVERRIVFGLDFFTKSLKEINQ